MNFDWWSGTAATNGKQELKLTNQSSVNNQFFSRE